jgi:hypothetical protein
MKKSTRHLIIWMDVTTLLLFIVTTVSDVATMSTSFTFVVKSLGYFLVLFLIGCYFSLLFKWVQTWGKKKTASCLEKADSSGHCLWSPVKRSIQDPHQ